LRRIVQENGAIKRAGACTKLLMPNTSKQKKFQTLITTQNTKPRKSRTIAQAPQYTLALKKTARIWLTQMRLKKITFSLTKGTSRKNEGKFPSQEKVGK